MNEARELLRIAKGLVAVSVSKVRKLTEPYDGVSGLECDGMTRVLHTVLSKNRIPHKVMGGSVSFGGKSFEPHVWIELPGGMVVDYRARMWLGRKAPHGVFNPEREDIEYDGRSANFPILNDFLFDVLSGGVGMRTAGIIQPPPAMVDEMSRWSKAKIGVNKVLDAQGVIQNLQMLIDANRQRKDEGGDEESRKQSERWMSEYVEDIERQKERIKRWIPHIKSYPGVRIDRKKWRRTSKKFKADLKGWRYLPRVKQATPERRQYADKLFGVVTVELVEGDIQGNAKAYWKSGSSVLRISVGMNDDLHDIFKHELRHWAQSYMNVIIGKNEAFGRPSRKIRTPDINQWARGEAARILKNHGIKPDEFHSLDDVEFYTDLADAIIDFEKKAKHVVSLEPDFPDERAFFDEFVGMGRHGDEYMNHFFKALKRHSRGKWQKAVKELAKAVL